MRVLFIVRQSGRVQPRTPADFAHDEHIRIVPVAGAGEAPTCPARSQSKRRFSTNRGCRRSCASSWPAAPIGRSAVRRVVGKAIDKVPAAGLQGVGHQLCLSQVDRVPIVFQVVEPPIGPLLGVRLGKRVFAGCVRANVFVDLFPALELVQSPSGLSAEPPAYPAYKVIHGVE